MMLGAGESVWVFEPAVIEGVVLGSSSTLHSWPTVLFLACELLPVTSSEPRSSLRWLFGGGGTLRVVPLGVGAHRLSAVTESNLFLLPKMMLGAGESAWVYELAVFEGVGLGAGVLEQKKKRG